MSENRSDLILKLLAMLAHFISNDPWSFMALVNCLGLKPYFAGVKTIRLVYSSMKIPATRTAVRAHSGNRWVGFLEGIDAQKLSRSTHCKQKIYLIHFCAKLCEIARKFFLKIFFQKSPTKLRSRDHLEHILKVSAKNIKKCGRR